MESRPIRTIVMLWLFMAAVMGMVWMGTGCRSASTLYLRGHEDGYAAYWRNRGGRKAKGYQVGYMHGWQSAENLDVLARDRE